MHPAALPSCCDAVGLEHPWRNAGSLWKVVRHFGNAPKFPVWKTGVVSIGPMPRWEKVVGTEGNAPSFPVCKTGVLLLNQVPVTGWKVVPTTGFAPALAAISPQCLCCWATWVLEWWFLRPASHRHDLLYERSAFLSLPQRSCLWVGGLILRMETLEGISPPWGGLQPPA